MYIALSVTTPVIDGNWSRFQAIRVECGKSVTNQWWAKWNLGLLMRHKSSKPYPFLQLVVVNEIHLKSTNHIVMAIWIHTWCWYEALWLFCHLIYFYLFCSYHIISTSAREIDANDVKLVCICFIFYRRNRTQVTHFLFIALYLSIHSFRTLSLLGKEPWSPIYKSHSSNKLTLLVYRGLSLLHLLHQQCFYHKLVITGICVPAHTYC